MTDDAIVREVRELRARVDQLWSAERSGGGDNLSFSASITTEGVAQNRNTTGSYAYQEQPIIIHRPIKLISTQWDIRNAGDYEFSLRDENGTVIETVTVIGVLAASADNVFALANPRVLQPGVYRLRMTRTTGAATWSDNNTASLSDYYPAWDAERQIIYDGANFGYTAPFDLNFYDGVFANYTTSAAIPSVIGNIISFADEVGGQADSGIAGTDVVSAVSLKHAAATIGATANGLSIAGQVISLAAATAASPGAATAAQITKLDGIYAGAQVNVLEGVTGTAPIVAGAIVAKSQAISISAATPSAAGSMSGADKTKSDQITITAGKTLAVTESVTLAAASAGYTLTVPESLIVAGRNVVNTFLSGQIVGSGVGNATFDLDGAAGYIRQMQFKSGGVVRWLFRVDGTAESGSNAGSNWVIISRADDGSVLSVPFFMERKTGFVRMGGSSLPSNQLSVSGAIDTSSSVLIGTTTDGMTAGGSLAIAQDLAHRGTLAGFFNAAPVVKQTGYAVPTDLASCISALTTLRTALINYGLHTTV